LGQDNSVLNDVFLLIDVRGDIDRNIAEDYAPGIGRRGYYTPFTSEPENPLG
jgi:hypothetical protein